MKRNKSFRKSIAKKFKKKEKLGGGDHVDGGHATAESRESNVRNIRAMPPARPAPPSQGEGVQVETRTSIGARIEGGRKVEVIKVEGKKDPASLIGDTQPLPAHIQNDAPRSMDRLRRSIRHSIRKRKETAGPEITKLQKWHIDEAAVRSGTCKFYVKYFGCCEVYESRGMQVCEAAVESLKAKGRRTVRGSMYVSGDSIRLVDDDTKAMVLDQTIEKVSFCAPDRNFDRGFSYICRDGTTRRWMCHAFFAVGDTGERLSHAVGCAFGICLENKQKREKMTNNVSMNYNDKEASFTRVGTFKTVSIKQRLADPQALKPVESPKLSIASSSDKSSVAEEGIAGVERPRPSDVMYQRQASFRGLGQLSGNTPFKRGGKGSTSLRLNDLPSTKDRLGVSVLSDSPILEDIELPPSNLEQELTGSRVAIDLLTSDEVADITGANTGLVGVTSTSGHSTPAPPSTASNYSMSPPPTTTAALLQPLKLHNVPEVSPNPWDLVPDQPPPSSSSSLQPTSSADSWLNSLTSSITSGQLTNDNVNILDASVTVAAMSKQLSVDVQNSSKSNGTSSGYNSPSSTGSSEEVAAGSDNTEWQTEVNKSILEDPFDAEWAAIATRNSSAAITEDTQANSNPFLTTESSVKAFELQL